MADSTTTSEAGRTPPPGDRFDLFDHGRLGPWTVNADGLAYKGAIKGDPLMAGADKGTGDLFVVFVPMGTSDPAILHVPADMVRSMSRQGLARCIARHGYGMERGCEAAVAGFLLACWNNGEGRDLDLAFRDAGDAQ